MSGYIKDYRKETKSDIWLMPPLYHRVWQWLKYQVNHEDSMIPQHDGSKLLIKRGQHLTSVRSIAQGVGWYEGPVWKEPNPKTISSILDWLEKVKMIVINRGRGNRQYTLITLINWEVYQPKEHGGNSKVTANGEGSKQQTDINKNVKNVKEIYIAQFNEFWNLYPKKVGKAKAQEHWLKTVAGKIDFEEIMAGTRNYIQHCKETNRYLKDGSAYVNQLTWNDFIDLTAHQSKGLPSVQKGAYQSKKPRNAAPGYEYYKGEGDI
jgi:hypothetical protein